MKKSESVVQAEIMCELSKIGRAFRNNVGVAYRKDGVPVRYGLANITKKMNKKIKSSDVVGIIDTGQFIAIECKREGWVYTGTPREVAQQRFIDIIREFGGVAGFAQSVEDYNELLKEYMV